MQSVGELVSEVAIKTAQTVAEGFFSGLGQAVIEVVQRFAQP